MILVSEPSSLLFQGKAEGRRTALWFRARLQSQLFQLGCFLHSHAGKVLFVAVLVLSTFCVGLKSAVIHSRAEQLWVEGELPYNTMHLPLEQFERNQLCFYRVCLSFQLLASSLCFLLKQLRNSPSESDLSHHTVSFNQTTIV